MQAGAEAHRLQRPGFFVNFSGLVAKFVETGFIATYAWAMKLYEVL
ncbi:hypothetical protein MicvaDRAFT_4241 [Microcoleus vaginatus FGP-2]|nr:hypothetical protein MicvaDRAFT_4241 [Microcoleus vaginatus FGP-2]